MFSLSYPKSSDTPAEFHILFERKKEPMCPGRSVLKSRLIVAPDWGIFPRKGSQVQPFLFKADKYFYGSRLAVVEVTGSLQCLWVSLPSMKVSLSNSAWRQWSMKRLKAFQENKVCLNHLGRITPSSFVEKSAFHCLSYLCYEKKPPFIQLAAQWSRPTSARHSLCPSPCLLALGLQHE